MHTPENCESGQQGHYEIKIFCSHESLQRILMLQNSALAIKYAEEYRKN